MSTLKLMTLVRIACLAVIAAPTLGAQARMKAGQWEYSATRGAQTSTHTVCVTAAQADTANGSAAIIRAQMEKSLEKASNCKLTDFKLNATSQSVTMTCGPSSMTNVTTFHGGESAETVTTTRAEGKEYVSTIKMRRLGACTANNK